MGLYVSQCVVNLALCDARTRFEHLLYFCIAVCFISQTDDETF
jgi:hypothetical protein